jgi:hypothetical protein
MTKRLQRLLVIMLIVPFFLAGLALIAIFSYPIIETKHLTGLLLVIVSLAVIFSTVVCAAALALKRQEKQGAVIAPARKKQLAMLLKVMFVAYLGIPAILLGAYTVYAVVHILTGMKLKPDEDVHVGSGINLDDPIWQLFGIMFLCIFSGVLVYEAIKWLFTTGLPTLNEDF